MVVVVVSVVAAPAILVVVVVAAVVVTAATTATATAALTTSTSRSCVFVLGCRLSCQALSGTSGLTLSFVCWSMFLLVNYE